MNTLHEPGLAAHRKKTCNKNRWQDNKNATLLHKTSGLSCFSFHCRSHPAAAVEKGTNQSQQHSRQSNPNNKTFVKTKTYMLKAVSFFAEAPQPMATTRWNLKLALKSLRQVPKQQHWVVAEPSVQFFSATDSDQTHSRPNTTKSVFEPWLAVDFNCKDQWPLSIICRIRLEIIEPWIMHNFLLRGWLVISAMVNATLPVKAWRVNLTSASLGKAPISAVFANE